jgi:hypothetical protein
MKSCTARVSEGLLLLLSLMLLSLLRAALALASASMAPSRRLGSH